MFDTFERKERNKKCWFFFNKQKRKREKFWALFCSFSRKETKSGFVFLYFLAVSEKKVKVS